MGKFYITTTLPYVNADPHIGFALEIVQADAIARYHAAHGDEVFFNTGTDEHGLKIYRNALATGKDPQAYADEWAEKFRALKEKLSLFPDLIFIRTTDAHHKTAAQEFWRRCAKSGDIYKKNYEVKYCVGCEMEKTDSELADGKCPFHPNLVLELISEENYFFRFSKYQKPLLELYEKTPWLVAPDFRFNEIKRFVESGLQDFSISRLKEKMPWGVPVPDDPEQVMYVWFDALVNYISTLGWPEDTEKFAEFWGTAEHPNALQVAGKDNIRQQSAMWTAMLMSAQLPLPKQILIHGFVTSGGQKMSKSLGNVVNPYDVVEKYGVDALRYYLLREIPTFEDGDFTEDHFRETYNASLANGLGNLVARVMKMATTHLSLAVPPPSAMTLPEECAIHMDAFEIKKAMDAIWARIGDTDRFIQETEPYRAVKTDKDKALKDIRFLVEELWEISESLEPFLPATAEKIRAALLNHAMPEPLFPRLG